MKKLTFLLSLGMGLLVTQLGFAESTKTMHEQELLQSKASTKVGSEAVEKASEE